MRAFVFVSCFVAVAIARPQEDGYNYAPGSHYEPPGASSSVVGASYSVSGGEQSYSSGGAFNSGSQIADTGANYNAAPSFSSGSAISSGSSFGGGPSFDTGAPSFGGANSGFGGGAAAGGATTVIQKHIYVHVPPPEPEQPQHQQQGAGGVANQKHYKIIFIKAPSAPTYSASQLAAQQAANSEKTIVYVLVKKPEEHVDATGNVVPGQPVVPSKPEVYFIKWYKTQGAGSSGGSAGGSSDVSSGGQIGSGSTIVGGNQTHAAYGVPQ